MIPTKIKRWINSVIELILQDKPSLREKVLTVESCSFNTNYNAKKFKRTSCPSVKSTESNYSVNPTNVGQPLKPL